MLAAASQWELRLRWTLQSRGCHDRFCVKLEAGGRATPQRDCLISTLNGLAEPDNDKLAAIPWLKVWGAWDTMLQEPWDKVAAYANPRQSVSSNLIKLSTYHSWFMTGDIPQEELEAGYPQGMPRYIRHTSGIPFTYVKQLMRFRTGAHHLAIETGRWARPKLPRQHRVCSKCSRTVVEDEVHFLFECPAYELPITKWPHQMIEFVRSIIPFCLHSLEVARKLLVQ